MADGSLCADTEKMKRCPRCAKFKTLAEYGKRLERPADYCKPCLAALSREWRLANLDRSRAHDKKKREKNPEKIAARNHAWREKNWAKFLANEAIRRPKKRDVIRQNYKRWYAGNAAKVLASVRRYQLTKRRAMPAWANHRSIELIYEEAARITKTTGIPHHVDHIVPLRGDNVCGLHWEGNLQILPATVNRAKHNRLLEDA